jgi:FixJ family two-component response regulator
MFGEMTGASVVAVIDDDPSIRAAVGCLLRSAGFAVLLFASAGELLETGDLRSIGCMILDWRMPGMDGLQLQRDLSASGWRTPVIILTAHADERGRARAMAAGAIAFLTKPFDSEALLAAVVSGVSDGLAPVR